MAAKKKDEPATTPLIRVTLAPLGELKAYTVTEDELDQLGRGSPGSIYLNFGLALVPVAVAFLITIISTDIPTLVGKIFFIAGCILFFLVGALCLVLAGVHHVSNRSLVEKIKNRMPPPEPSGPEPSPSPPSSPVP